MESIQHHPSLAFETVKGKKYYADDITKILKSNQQVDQWELNNIILEAVWDDSPVALQYLLEKGYKICEVDRPGKTFFQWAFYARAHKLLSSVIDFCIPHITEDVVKNIDLKGLTILHVACYTQSTSDKLVEKCLACNANVNAQFRSDPFDMQRDGFTPIHFATINPNGLHYLKLLIDHKADINAKDSRGRTPLHISCRVFEDPNAEEFFGVYKEAAELFLDNGANVNAKDGFGDTPLLSLFPERYDVYKENKIHGVPVEETMSKLKLFVKRGADVTAINQQGDNILHLIVKNLKYMRRYSCNNTKTLYKFHDNDHLEMIQLILNTRSDYNFNTKNVFGETPMQIASLYLSADIIKVLINNTERFEKNLDFEDAKYFDYLVTHRNTNEVPKMEEVVNFLTILEIFTNKGFEVNALQNLNILAYLTHDYDCCDCSEYEAISDHTISTGIFELYNFGSSSHFESVYEKLMTNLSNRSLTNLQKMVFHSILKYFEYSKHANIYIDSTLTSEFTLSEKLSMPSKELVILDYELNRMKSTKLNEGSTLYDVMCKHPHNIYRYLTDINFDGILHDYSIYESIIKGHITKSLVRHHVEKSALDVLKGLLPPICPVLCCKIIMNYLKNEDILNVCRAVIDN